MRIARRDVRSPGGRNNHPKRHPAFAAREAIFTRGRVVLDAWGKTSIGAG